MPEWERSTRARSAQQLPPDFRDAVERFAEREGVEGALEGVAAACSTSSMPLGRRGFLRRRSPHETWALVSERWLVVVSDATGDAVAAIYPAAEVEVREFASPLIDDTGIEITGFVVGATERSTRFVPLDGRSAGQAFRAELAR